MAPSWVVLSTIVCLLTFKMVTCDRFHVDKDHLQEELNQMMPDEEFELKDDDQMQFHYFKIHDHNNDNKLDGLELGAAMTHYHEEEGGQGEQKQVDISDDELKDMIDQLLKDDDLNDDGYVDFYEFVNAQKKTGSQ